MKFYGCISILSLASALPNEYISSKNQAKIEQLSKDGLDQGVHKAQGLVDAYQVKGFDGEVLNVAELSKQAMEQGALEADGVMENAEQIVEENRQMVEDKLNAVRGMNFRELLAYGGKLAVKSVDAAFPENKGLEKAQESRSINRDLNKGIKNIYVKLAREISRDTMRTNVGVAMDQAEDGAKRLASELVDGQMNNGGREIKKVLQLLQQQGHTPGRVVHWERTVLI